MKIDIRGDNVTVPRWARHRIVHRARLAFGRVQTVVTELRIVVRDVNGPRGGNDIECVVIARIDRGDDVRTAAVGGHLPEAAVRAIERAARAAERAVARRSEFTRETVRRPVLEGVQ